MSEIDMKRVEQLRFLFKEQFSTRMEIFLKTIASYIDEIEVFVKTDSRTEVTSIAHKLASSSYQVGLVEIGKLAEILERSGHDPSVSTQDIHTSMKQEFQDLDKKMKAVINENE